MNRLDAITGNKFPVFNFGSDLMNLKFLIVLTMVICAFCVIPVNADTIYDNIPVYVININTENYNILVHNADSVYLIGAWGATLPQQPRILATYQHTTINGYDITPNGNVIYEGYSPEVNSLPLISVLNAGVQPYIISNPNHYNSISYTAVVTKGVSGSQSVTGTITFTYDDNYQAKTNTAYIQTDIDHYTNNTVTYNVKCKSEFPNNIYYSSIGNYRDFTLGLINYNETETETQITTGLNGTNIYAWCMDINNGNIQLLQSYLSGRSEIDIPIEPTPQPTDTPIYPDRIQAIIQTFDYQSGNMVSGVNLSVYEVIDHDTYAELGQLVYSSASANSQTVLQLKNNTDYFVINNLDGYFAVKNTVYPYFNGLEGYWWSLPYYHNPLLLYYSKLDASAQYNANFIVHDTNQNGLSGVSVTMDNSQTLITNNIGGVSFQNVSAGSHTFVFVKNGYQTAQRTIDIQMQYASFDQVLYKDNQIVQPTVQPTAYPTIQPTVQPTISPIDKPTNLAESVKYGLAKMFGVNSLNTINLIFALMIILFPAVVAGVITNQALGFIAGGLIGFVFALGIGLIPIWVFFSMIMLSVIYLVMTHTESGF